jgi:hypothetical protein
MRKLLLSLCVIVNLILSSTAMAQDPAGAQGDQTFADESVKDIATVVGIAAGGAILGLSTLSFVEEPSEHLKNIVVGGAIGIIIGVGVVAMSQANKSKSLYQDNASLWRDPSIVNSPEWKSAKNIKTSPKYAPQVGLSFTF